MLHTFITKIMRYIGQSRWREHQPAFYHNQIAQREIFLSYKNKNDNNKSTLNFRDAGFRVYSQTDEDGLLLYIFSLIGFTNRMLVDMAFGSPYNANSTNLLLNWGFHGLVIEGNPANVKATKRFFKSHPDSKIFPPLVVNAWITAENVNDILKKNGFVGEIDLFSLDMDGVDYWIWKTLEVISPRVVIVEYQDILGWKKALSVPYNAQFNRHEIHEDFFGASLPAFLALAEKKGYRLIGCNKYCYNAFFVREDISRDILPECSVEKCFEHPKVYMGIKKRLPEVQDLPWVSVENEIEKSK